MSDNGSDCFDEPWIAYREREEWKDISPVPQDDGPHPIVQIAYSDKCKNDIIYYCYNLCKHAMRRGGGCSKARVIFSVLHLVFYS